MTAHSIQVKASTEIISDKSESELKKEIEKFIENYEEVVSKKNSAFSKVEESPEGDSYYSASFRLSFDSIDKSTIVSKMESYLKNNFDWWAWNYHECVDDEGGSCPYSNDKNSSNKCPESVRF